MLAAPFAILTILYAGFVVGLFFWIFYTNKSYNDLVLFFTLIILIFYTYYTLQVVKSTYSGPALLHVQIEHSDTLKLFLRKWLEELKELPTLENIPYKSDTRYVDKYKMFEERWQYRDLLDHHLPENYRNLRDDWNNLKELTTEMELIADKLFKLICEEVERQIDDIKSMNPKICVGEDQGITYLSSRIYQSAVSEYPEYRAGDLRLEVKKQQDELYQLTNLQTGIVFNGSREQMEIAKLELVKIADGNYIKGKYMNDINEIDLLNVKMKTKRDELQRKVEDLVTWTLLPGTSCERLKDFRIKP